MAFSVPVVPQFLREKKQWLVWRLVQRPDEPKPLKVPFYVSGEPRNGDQGTAEDVAALGTFDQAVRACMSRGYTGLGFALLAGSGVIALDFDHCVRDGEILDSRIEALIADTYAEISPSGTGLRAFFAGDLPSRKDNAHKRLRVGGQAGAPRLDGKFDVEVFGSTGFVTITGNHTGDVSLWGLEDTVAPVSTAVRAMFVERFGEPGALVVRGLGDDDAADLFGLGATKLGWTLAQARDYLFDCSASVSREEWLNALMALHYEFDGSDEALDLADEWSATGDSYAGRRDVEGRWRSFGRSRGSAPLTGRWLLSWRRDQVAAKQDERMREALAEMQKLIEGAPDMLGLQAKVMPQVSSLLSDFPILEIEAFSLVSSKAKSFGTPITKAEFKKLVKRDRPAASGVTHQLTEFGNVARLVDRYKDSLMYVPDAGQWYVWTGVYWRKALGNRTEIAHFCKEVIRLLPDEKDAHVNNQEEFFAFCAASQRSHMVSAMVVLAESEQTFCVPSSELDKHRHLLGVKNGVVDLRTGELMPPDADYRITCVTACEYNPGAKAPLFQRSLRDAFYDDDEMVEYVMRTFGYAIQGNPKESAMFIAFGNGANGKGTVIDSVRKALGGYARAVSPETFLADGKSAGGNGGGPREDLVRLRGARMLYVNEPDEHGELKEGLVKAMTGGDTITARGVHALSSIEIVPTWTIYMPTNYKPVIKGDDNGIWRRLRLLPFERNFRDDPNIKEDKTLKDRIEANELPGILAAMVRAGLRYQQIGLESPAKVKAVSEAYRRDQDLLGDWLDECCELGPGLRAKSMELWESWKLFAEKRGFINYVRSSKSLGRRLDSRFPCAKGTGGVRERVGLALKTNFDIF